MNTGTKEFLAKCAHNLDRATIFLLFLLAFVQPLSVAAAFIAYSAMGFLWVVRLALGGRGTLQRSPLDIVILVYWLLSFLSVIVSPLPAASWEGMRKVNLIFLAIVTAHIVSNQKRARQLIGIMILATLVGVTYAAWQLIAGVGLHVSALKTDSAFYRAGLRDDDVILRVDNHLFRSPEKFLMYIVSADPNRPIRLLVVHDMGFDVLKDGVPITVSARDLPRVNNSRDLGMTVVTEHLARARALYSHPVTYAMVLESLACIVIGLWLASPNKSSAKASGLLGVFVVLVLTLGVTLTRAAWLSFACGCLLLVWLHDRRKWVRAALPALLILAALATNSAVRHWRGVGLIDMNDPGSEYRILMWRDGVRLIMEHPWFGVGMNTIRDVWWEYHLTAFSKYGMRSHFHSAPIQIAVAQGIPVAIAWFALMLSYWLMLLRLVKKARERNDQSAYGLAMGLLGATTAFLISSTVQNNFGDSVVVIQFWFFAGLALALEREMRQGSSSSI